MVVAILAHSIDIHGITVDGFTFACFTAVDNTGCHSFQDNLSSFFFVNTKVLKYSFIHHSFSNLSDDRSNASSKTVPPHSAI